MFSGLAGLFNPLYIVIAIVAFLLLGGGTFDLSSLLGSLDLSGFLPAATT